MILNDSLQQLGDLACQQLQGAIEGLAMQNQANLDTVIEGDAALDALEAEINEKAIEVIAIRSPRAQDLRYVLVAFESGNDFSSAWVIMPAISPTAPR